MTKKSIFLILFSLLALVATLAAFISDKKNDSDTSATSMKGLCWVAGDSIAQHNITHIIDIGANWISQTPFGWMSGHDSPEVVLSNDRAWWGETDRGIAHTAALAKASNVKTMLKPHIWLRSKGNKWRSEIEMKNAEEWDQWFASYRSWILHYAVVAEKSNIEALCIGTELYQTTKQHPDKWKSIIADIRKVYSGQLTYAANWYKEYEDITFWGDLDYIGIQAYFPLSNSDDPPYKDLLKSWKKHKKKLKSIAEKYNKKIVFTEVGYKNTSDSAKEPWTWPQNSKEATKISEQVQVDCYNAMFESLWHEPWFDGLFIWKWFHTTYKHKDIDTYITERKERRRKRHKSQGVRAQFSPQEWKALDVLSEWYLSN